MYPYEENALFLLILTVFLVRVHFFTIFFYLSENAFQKSKKSVLFLLLLFDLSDFKRVKKVYPYEENFFTNFDCFPRKGTLFLLFFSIYQISKE